MRYRAVWSHQTTLCTVAGVSWASKTRCVRWPVCLGCSKCAVYVAFGLSYWGWRLERGVRPGCSAVGHRDGWSHQTTLCTVPGVSWASKTRCVRCPVCLGCSKCAVYAAFGLSYWGWRLERGGCAGCSAVGTLPSGITKPRCAQCPVCLGRPKHGVCGAWCALGAPNVLCIAPSGKMFSCGVLRQNNFGSLEGLPWPSKLFDLDFGVFRKLCTLHYE